MNTSSGHNWRTGLKLLLLVGLAMGVGWQIAPAMAAPFAYVSNNVSNTVTVIDTATNTVVGDPIPVGNLPEGVAITPDGQHAYVTNLGSDTVSVIDTATNTVVGDPIPVGGGPAGVAITPDGQRAYVTNYGSNTVSVIDTATNTVVGDPIPVAVGGGPVGVAITPDGQHAYVTNPGSDTVSVIDTATNTTVVGYPYPGIKVGGRPDGVAITPDGQHAYVANVFSDSVSVIDTATNTVVVNPGIRVGRNPIGVAITPDGQRAYVTNSNFGTVSVIDTATNTVVGDPIPVGGSPQRVAITPDGQHAYVTNPGSGTVSVIDTATNTVVGNPIPVGIRPLGIAITPMGPRLAGPRLARWKLTTALPKPSAVAGLTGKELNIINGRAYVFGGQNATGSRLLTNVYFSALNADGSLGPWVETTPLPKTRPYFDYATVNIGNYVYLITGADGSEDVYYAPILADGSVGQWIPTAPLASRQTFAAAAYGNFIYVAGGNSGGTINLVTYTSVNADGSLQSWQNTTPLLEPIQSHTMVATHGRLYVVAPSNRVYYAAIEPEGTVGPWTSTSSLPVPENGLYGYSSFELNGYLYTVAGNLNTSYYAQILADGSLAAWQPTTALPATRLYTRAGAHNNFVYVAGGYDGANFFRTVYYSPLAAKVGGAVTGLEVGGVSCVNNKTSQTVNVADPAATWNCEEAGLVVNSKDGIRMTVTGNVDLTAPVGGSSTGLLLNSVRCINDTTRQALTIDMKNLPPSWNCEAAGLQVNSRDIIRMNINGGAE